MPSTARPMARRGFFAQGTDYDALVLDLMLPKLDGWQLLDQLRVSKKTPVLILTARDAVTDRVRGLDGGADDYLVKPFELTELFARLRALIRRAGRPALPAIALGEITVDTRSRTVFRARAAGSTDRPRVCAGGVTGPAAGRGRLAHADVRTSVRRVRRHAVEPAGCTRLECAPQIGQGVYYHPPRLGVLDRWLNRFAYVCNCGTPWCCWWSSADSPPDCICRPASHG